MIQKGVFKAVHKDGSIYYRSSITFRGKHISLGSFNNAAKAGRSYRSASLILNDGHIGIPDHNKHHELSFDKFVVLCNYRDNGIYVSNPIYIRPHFFYYYMSPDIFFTFDQDDLFFFSAHKIMKRGGHYFVSEYGMQSTIYSRYGIPSYAVSGRDFTFRNGNPYDMRSTNLEIINSYTGVSRIITHSGISFRAKIHINGYCIIGSYKTPEEAAIAYNKAADTIIRCGLTKNYMQNYIDSISPSRYADIYSSVHISSNIEKICMKIISQKNLSC